MELEAQRRKVDGSYCWWLIRGLPLRSSTGAITKRFGTCTDIDGLKVALSARDKAERDASARAAVMDALFESVPDVVTQLDTAGRIRLVNHTSSHCDRQAALPLPQQLLALVSIAPSSAMAFPTQTALGQDENVVQRMSESLLRYLVERGHCQVDFLSQSIAIRNAVEHVAFDSCRTLGLAAQ